MGLLDTLLNTLNKVQDIAYEKQDEFYKELGRCDRQNDKQLIREFRDSYESSGNHMRKLAQRIYLRERGYSDKDR